MTHAHAAALDAHDAGLCVVPPRDDGSKAPLGEWKQFQDRRPSEEQIRVWYANGRTGVGIVCGAVSGNLEMLEFEGRARIDGTFDAFCDAAIRGGLEELLNRLSDGYSELTPTEGIHFLYRCSTIAGNTKLARRPATETELEENPRDKVKVLIETRGEGGYVITAPSSGNVHPTGAAWTMVSGGFDSVPTITPEEREELFNLARSFDKMPLKDTETIVVKHDAPSVGTRPGDDFAQQTSWGDILTPFGWKMTERRGGEEFWRRPGKDKGIHSATVNYKNSGLLYVFSSSTEFEPERGYGKFAAWTLLNHHGDYEAAAKELASDGYGQQADEIVVSDAKPEDPWDKPIPIDGGERLPLPVAHLPAWIREYVTQMANSIQVPPDAIFMQMLAALSTAVARFIDIELGPGWVQPLNTYTGVSMDPGERKTRISGLLAEPIEKLHGALWEKRSAAAKERFIVRSDIEHQIAQLEGELKSKTTKLKTEMERRGIFGKISDLKEELEALPMIPKPELLAEDATPEAMAQLIFEQGGRIAVITDEGGGLFGQFTGLYGNGSNFEIALRGHDGGRPLRINRVGRGKISVDRPIITLGLLIQPIVLISMAKHPELQGRGLLARFLYAIPTPRVGWRNSHPPKVRDDLQHDYVERVLELGMIALKDDLALNPAIVRLSPAAQSMLDEYSDGHEKRLRGNGDLAGLTGWGSKMPGALGRVAGLLHLAQHGTLGIGILVEESTMRAALSLSDYLIAHALIAHSMMGELGGIDVSRRILKWLTDSRDSGEPLKNFARSRAERELRIHLEDLQPGLDLLVQKGYLRARRGVTEAGAKRRDSVSYAVHPDFGTVS